MSARLPQTNEEAWALAGGWGAAREMNALEAFMWRAEASDPRMRSPVVAIEMLDSEPDWRRLRAAHEWGTQLIPRARMRVAEPPLRLGPPIWAADPDFDLDYHLRRVRAAAPGTQREVLDLAAQIAMMPFDRKRPPWEAVVVEGLEGGRAAYVVKVHHSATDGLGGIQLMSLLHSRVREHSPKKRVRGPEAPARPGLREVAEQLIGRVLDAPLSAARRLGETAGDIRRAAADPLATATAAIRFGSSLQRVMAPPPAPPSPLLGARSLSWRFDLMEVGLDELKRTAKEVGGSLNDAYVAALLGGFRLYHEAMGSPLDKLAMGMPISLRAGDSPMGGNRFAGARFAAPAGERDPATRIREVREFVLTARSEPAAMALGLLAPALGLLPSPLATNWYVAQSSRLDLQASNVAGLPHGVYLAGARIERIYPFGPLPGCAVMAVLLSYAGTCCIGFNSDRAAVTDGDLFAECMRLGLDEVLTLEPRHAPVRRGSAGPARRRRQPGRRAASSAPGGG